MRLVLAIMVMLCGGCMNITASLLPEHADVAQLREASDCVPIILGFAYGSATLEGALSEAVQTIESLKPGANVESTPQKISKIRRVQLHDYQFLMFGARCVEVVGE